jgi:hypothetical protein
MPAPLALGEIMDTIVVPDSINRPTTVLTPRGVVAASIVRLEYDLTELPAEDRAYCLDLVRDLLEGAGA